MQPKEYQQLVQENLPPRPIVKNMLWAFFVGGIICAIGQVVLTIAQSFERTKNEAAAVTLAAMIFLGTILTALGVYDEIAEKAGAGAAVPITGFANTVTSAAMDFRREGLLLGMGAKMFVIAGPVIVYGILAGFIVALIKSLVLGLF
ncbi:MAG TPA: stage V sporulation protein AC [Limnochordia bacterium]|nr:stage V sporulation protein AC [Limnochordia bacterium]